MSIQAVAWVLEHSQAHGISRLVLISLANHANAQTGQCNPGYRRIAAEAGIASSTVSLAVKELVELGELEITKPGTSHSSARYRLPWLSTSRPDFVREPNVVTASAKSTREVRALDRTKRARRSNESIKSLNQENASQKNHEERPDPEALKAALQETRRNLKPPRRTPSPSGRPRP